jgi:iron complex transport system substrate-binding protein
MMPCGYHLRETVAQAQAESWAANLPAAWEGIAAVRHGEIYAVDGTAYFSRPGPRLVDGLEILHAILSGRGFEHLPPDSVARL